MKNKTALTRAVIATSLESILHKNQSLDLASSNIRSKLADKAERSFAMASVYGVLRHYFSLSKVLRQLVKKPLKNKDNHGYHFMREDSLNNWSHKFAYGKATNKDLNDKKISNPLNSNLDYNYKPDRYSNYNELCGTFCIEESDISKEIRNKVSNSNFCNPN